MRFYNPPGVVAPASCYSHAAATDTPMRWLHIAGQVGISPAGEVREGFAAQLEQCFANVISIVRAEDMDIPDIVKLVIYVTPPPGEVVEVYRAIRDRMMAGHPAATTYLGVTGLASDTLLAEVEAVAAAPL